MPANVSRRKKPIKDDNIPELTLNISEVAKMLNTSASTLRLWENMGLIQPSRGPNGYRRYALSEIERLKEVQRLRLEKNANISAIREILPEPEEAPNAPAADSRRSIGKQLRLLRRQKKLTLADVAGSSGLSIGFLSALELGQSNASIATLQKLSVLYDTNVLSFFGHRKQKRKLVRGKDRERLSTEPGITIELLAFGKTAMEPHLFRIAPGTSSGGSYSHEGEEFVFLVSGQCEFWLDEVEHYRMQPGDSLYFQSTQTHRWTNPGKVEAVLLWINTPATF